MDAAVPTTDWHSNWTPQSGLPASAAMVGGTRSWRGPLGGNAMHGSAICSLNVFKQPVFLNTTLRRWLAHTPLSAELRRGLMGIRLWRHAADVQLS
jgi:hypothetical protein